jgi:polysaccharide deacetylase family protein (PEP-CTERM system associated)
MSVDVESWVHRPIFNIPLSEQTKELDEGHVLRSTRIILELFKAYHVRATFFILGTVAEWYPELIDCIKNDGHEIGIHGYTHNRLYNHTKETFDREIRKTTAILNSLGVEPRGYRSPVFSRADFLYEVLSENGIRYDSSILPIRTPLYDGTAYESRPFLADRGIIEIPCSVLKFSKLRLPVGGFYLRLLGGPMNCFLLHQVEKKNGISVMYFHPWEILDIPRSIHDVKGRLLKLSFVKRMLAYYNIPMLGKIEYLLRKISFTSFEKAMDYIDKNYLGRDEEV